MHENDVAQPGELGGRGAAGVVRGAQPGGSRARGRTEVNQLLSPDGPHAAMTVHGQHARQPTPHSGWAEEPRLGVGAVTDRPTQSSDQDAVESLVALIVHRRSAVLRPEAEHPAELGAHVVGADIWASGPYRSRPVLVAGERIRLDARGRCSASGQWTAFATRTGPALPRLSIRGRRKIAWPGGRWLSSSDIRCHACRPSSVTGTDAVVRGGMR